MPCSRTQHGLTRVGLEPPTSGSGVRGINHQATALPWTDCDEAGDYFVPNVLSPRDLVLRPDNIDKTVLHTYLLSEGVCKETICPFSGVGVHVTIQGGLGNGL